MNRSKRFIIGLASSYAAIGVNILYTIASVPLALSYLDKEEFGLWALIIQLSGYLVLLEFGMTGSVARSLSDHKDQVKEGTYGNILRTGATVFGIQGFFVFLLGLSIAFFAPSLLAIPTRLHHAFTVLMAAQAFLAGGKLAMGTLTSPLWSHQRLDISNMASSVSLIVTFSILWLGFHLGWHLYSLTVSTAAGSVVSLALTYIFCRRLGFYPPREFRGHFDPQIFWELFHFGGGLFLMNLGAQLASASQVIIVTRILGMETAAVWSIATKVFGMAQQFVAKILDSSAGGLAEMVVREETTTLKNRFRDLVSISAVMAVTASAGIALMNGAFVEVWTSGTVSWSPWNNFLLACVLFSTAVTRCHTNLVGITKQIRGMKFVYLFEGITFVALSLLLSRKMGLAGILLAALVCNVFITGIYGVVRTAAYFRISRTETISWHARPAGMLLVICVIFAFTRIPDLAKFESLTRFFIGAAAFTTLVLPALWFWGMDRNLRNEIGILRAKILKARR